ncbi:hypothetical protein MNB_ARC-1_13 [hydrothermal vent metagenome]|uniref:Uncharacterized protein n=1 Tax=hydrothermal vent metagenome TaxID=652676 RepID=A0A3B1DS28_9ZZZZ
MTILLISETRIITHIFNLVCAKLNIQLTISSSSSINSNFDIIIIEDKLFDDNAFANKHAKRVGIITNDKQSFQNKSNFIIKKPFLPSDLSNTIEKQCKTITTFTKNQDDIIHTQNNDQELVKNNNNDNQLINNIAEDISSTVLEESDESIVPSAFVQDGGILDDNELSKIKNILKTQQDDKEWVDLSDIIDQAINEVNQYKFNIKEPVKLLLNDYSMKEVSVLLNKLDKSLINALIKGEEITLKLRVSK